MNEHAPPENGKGASPAPIPNPFNSPRTTAGCAVAQVCAHKFTERQRFNALRLARLAMCDELTDWERAFIRDVAQLRKLSPKQQALLDRLCRQYLEAKTQ
jgi:hypothetical protein